jgi:hypothetical protein
MEHHLETPAALRTTLSLFFLLSLRVPVFFFFFSSLQGYEGSVHSLTPHEEWEAVTGQQQNPNLMDEAKYRQLVADHVMFKVSGLLEKRKHCPLFFLEGLSAELHSSRSWCWGVKTCAWFVGCYFVCFALFVFF